jgi:opacity protein-like surface antigen
MKRILMAMAALMLCSVAANASCYVEVTGAFHNSETTLSIPGTSATFGHDGKGLGLGAGCDFRAGNVFAGPVLRYTFNDSKHSIAGASFSIGNDLQAGGRIGVKLFEEFAVYGIAGVSFTEGSGSIAGLGSANKQHVGGFYGGGIEFDFNRHVALKVEYTRAEYSGEVYAAPLTVKPAVDTLRLGVAYKF